MRKRDWILIFLAILVFLSGLIIILYPSLKTAAFRQAKRNSIQQFDQYRSTAEIPIVSVPPVEDGVYASEPQRIFPELWAACVSFNAQLPAAQSGGLTEESMQQPSINLSGYGWAQEVFGYISIPTADIDAPLYLGGSLFNLNRGAAVLGQTSLPIGGESTNCVIAGHRTWEGILHPFIGLAKVQIGDLVYLTNPWETLTYQVVSTEVIFPDNMEKIRVQEGRDLLTVFTCTYPNTQRLVVTCERCEKGA